MSSLQTIIMALKSILSNKVRSFLTMLGVIIGVSSVITLVSLMNGYIEIQMASWNTFGANQIQVSYWGAESNFEETFSDFAYSELTDYVSVISPSLETSEDVYYLDKKLQSTRIYYTDNSFTELANFELLDGRNISPADIQNRTQVCVVGGFIKKQFFSGLSTPVGKTIKINDDEFLIVGVLDTKEEDNNQRWSQDNVVILPYSTVAFNDRMESTSITEFKLLAKDADSTEKAIEIINTDFAKVFSNANNVNAYTDNSWLESIQNEARVMTLLVGGIAGISLLVGGIGIMNIMLVSVTERTREIGIRMAIGAKRKNIILQFLVEASVVSGLGGILGISFGALATVVAGSFITGEIIYPSLGITIGAFIFSVLLGVVFGLYPANKASKLNPIEALRTQ